MVNICTTCRFCRCWEMREMGNNWTDRTSFLKITEYKFPYLRGTMSVPCRRIEYLYSCLEWALVPRQVRSSVIPFYTLTILTVRKKRKHRHHESDESFELIDCSFMIEWVKSIIGRSRVSVQRSRPPLRASANLPLGQRDRRCRRDHIARSRIVIFTLVQSTTMVTYVEWSFEDVKRRHWRFT